MSDAKAVHAGRSAGGWWDREFFGLWILVNAGGYLVIVAAGSILDQLASSATRNLVGDHRLAAILILAVAGAVLQGTVVGRWQWRLLKRRVPAVQRRRWVLATVMPAFALWLAVLAPSAVDEMAQGGDTLHVFRNGFVQALVLGPLIGLGQALALRGATSRWAWWLAANVITYVLGALLHQFAVWLHGGWSLPAVTAPYFPVFAFAVHGAWILWVTAPEVTSEQPGPGRRRR